MEEVEVRERAIGNEINEHLTRLLVKSPLSLRMRRSKFCTPLFGDRARPFASRIEFVLLRIKFILSEVKFILLQIRHLVDDRRTRLTKFLSEIKFSARNQLIFSDSLNREHLMDVATATVLLLLFTDSHNYYI